MKAISQIIILVAVATVAIIGLVSSPADGAACWAVKLIAGKVVAVAAALAFIVMYSSWRRSNRLLRYYDRWCRG